MRWSNWILCYDSSAEVWTPRFKTWLCHRQLNAALATRKHNVMLVTCLDKWNRRKKLSFAITHIQNYSTSFCMPGPLEQTELKVLLKVPTVASFGYSDSKLKSVSTRGTLLIVLIKIHSQTTPHNSLTYISVLMCNLCFPNSLCLQWL